MNTTVVRPPDPTLRPAIRLATGFGLFVLLFHVLTNLWQVHLGYGYFRDEMYYILCGRHLAWGYVDHGPIVALQARMAELVFGDSITGIRILPAVAGGLRIFLTGALAWSLGGRRPAQALAMTGMLVAPQYLAADSYLSMNSWEATFWMVSLLALIQMAKGGSQKLWIVFGIAAGVGLLNKPSMTFFLVALLIGLLLTPQRQLLFSRWMLFGVALMVLIASPFLVWQMQNHWPTWEFLHNGKVEHKNVAQSPLGFLNLQWIGLHPLNIVLWGAGVIFLLRAKQWRWIGITYVVFLLVMMQQGAKDYYVMPIYPVLFAAGGLAWERQFAKSKAVIEGRMFAFPIYESLLLVTGVLILPMAIPVLKPTTWIAYTTTMHLYNSAPSAENLEVGPLPQFYADRFGWQEEVDEIARIYQSLSPEDKARATILCSNYGEASAVNFLGHGLPVAISGHNNYYLWGTGGATGDVVIAVSGNKPEEMKKFYNEVQIVGHMGHPYGMPYEHRDIYLLRGRKINLTDDWPELKHYI